MLYMVSKQRLRIWTRDSLDAIYIVGKLWLWIGTPTAMPKELFLQFATSDQNKCRLPICDYVSVIYRSLKMLGMVLISFRSYIPFLSQSIYFILSFLIAARWVVSAQRYVFIFLIFLIVKALSTASSHILSLRVYILQIMLIRFQPFYHASLGWCSCIYV
jgi:hypothetical protein